MRPFDLSVFIPSRNEFFGELDLLSHTVANVLANTSERTEVIVVLDGWDSNWPLEPLEVSPRVTVIHHRKSIGQRAACNEAARVSRAKWICKLDAHCAVGPQFDTLMTARCDYPTTLIPVQFNLHAFSWRCKKCSHETYQGPRPDRCSKCHSRYLKIALKWEPRGWKERNGVWEGRPKTTAWRFDSTLHFQYWSDLAKRYPPDQRLTPTMSCLGACWMLQRERYWELDGMDEKHGSWGQQGTELACKTWLSGGQMLVNHDTWFAHLFRTQSGPLGTDKNFSFPYSNPGGEKARARSREVWLHNKWPKQKYPLSWLVDKFKPVRDWHTIDNNPVLEVVNKAGRSFSPVVSSTRGVSACSANSLLLVPSSSNSIKEVSVDATSFIHGDNGNGVGVSAAVEPVISNQDNVGRIAAGRIVADDMIQDGNTATAPTGDRFNQPSVHEPMGHLDSPSVVKVSVPQPASGSIPNPAIFRADSLNSGKQIDQSFSVNVADGKQVGHGLTIPRSCSIGYLYYTCNTHDDLIEMAARNNLLKCKNGNELGCVSRERTDFGDWNIVIQHEKGPLSMHLQILAGLERLRSDYVFFCENDILYHPSHFEFVPPDKTSFWYNVNVWRVRSPDGHAVKTADCKQLSGLCCWRELAVKHYRERVRRIEAEGFSRKNGYEPGTRGLPNGYDDNRAQSWSSAFPNLDIRHGSTVTGNHWTPESFRNPKYAAGWEETDGEIAGWGQVSGQLELILEGLARG